MGDDETPQTRWERLCAQRAREDELFEIHRRDARARLGPLASAFEVEVLARASLPAVRGPWATWWAVAITTTARPLGETDLWLGCRF